jgi:predicted transposase/invertase (TIGR01784 family)
MGVNAKYKDSVFSFLFGKPDVLRSLYSAIEGVALPDDIPITINTLEGVLYKGYINDISFEIGGKIVVLIEHQSTVNPNMALRLLMYIGRVYEKLVGNRDIYASKKLSIPRPEFFVLYNGVEPYPDEETLRLSDLFERFEIPGAAGKISLELEAKVININEGRNRGILLQSRELAGYSAFIAKVREFKAKYGDLETGMKEAIRYCCEHDILKEFFEQNATEVVGMLMTEWNWDDALAVRYEEGREEGREKNMIITAQRAIEKGLPFDMIHEITGLDLETIKNLAK